MKEKSVVFSYPTSPNAERFGFPNGCWTVSIGKQGGKAKAVAGFATQKEALRHANSLPEPYSCWSMNLGHVKACHDPRNDSCAHNTDPQFDCQCKSKVKRNRKAFKVVRVVDPSHSYNTKAEIVMEIYPNGVLYFREERCKTRFQTTTATIFEQLRRNEALKAAAAKKANRRKKRS